LGGSFCEDTVQQFNASQIGPYFVNATRPAGYPFYYFYVDVPANNTGITYFNISMSTNQSTASGYFYWRRNGFPADSHYSGYDNSYYYDSFSGVDTSYFTLLAEDLWTGGRYYFAVQLYNPFFFTVSPGGGSATTTGSGTTASATGSGTTASATGSGTTASGTTASGTGSGTTSSVTGTGSTASTASSTGTRATSTASGTTASTQTSVTTGTTGVAPATTGAASTLYTSLVVLATAIVVLML
jgi:hypothetical protein